MAVALAGAVAAAARVVMARIAIALVLVLATGHAARRDQQMAAQARPARQAPTQVAPLAEQTRSNKQRRNLDKVVTCRLVVLLKC